MEGIEIHYRVPVNKMPWQELDLDDLRDRVEQVIEENEDGEEAKRLATAIFGLDSEDWMVRRAALDCISEHTGL